MRALRHRITNLNLERSYGDCSECGPFVFVKVHMTRGNRKVYCGFNHLLHRSKANSRLGGYAPLNATRTELDTALVAQQGKCAICSKATPELAPDHHHTTGSFRGWLCPNCNVALGMLKDDPEKLRAALDYLMRG